MQRPRPPGRRGLSLLEILLALTLILAMAAIVLPPLLRTLDDRAFTAGWDVASRQLLLARAEAQASGGPVEVLYLSEPPRIVARRFRADEPVADERGGRASRDGATRMPPSDPDSRIGEPWAYREMPDGVRMSHVAPPELLEELADVVRGSEREFLADDPAGVETPDELEPLRVAVFLPDGSALLAEPIWMIGKARRAGRLTINPWTGLPVFEPIEALSSASREEADEPDELDDELETEPPDEPESETDSGTPDDEDDEENDENDEKDGSP